MLMSRRYWSSDPSSNDDFLLFGVVAMLRVRGTAARRAWGTCLRRVKDHDQRRSISGRAGSMYALTETHPSNVRQPGEFVGGVRRETEVDNLGAATQQ